MAVLNMAHTGESAISARAPYRKKVRRFIELLHIEPVLLRQSLLVLLFCALIDLLPGYFLGSLERYLILVPGLLVILPPTVGLRGNTFGALASRLSSKLHLGVIEPKFRKNRDLKDQIVATGIQLMALSALIPFIGGILGYVFGIEFASLSTLLFISLSAGLISGVMMFIISLGITFLAFRNGWDPDNISAPIIASSGDILTIPILFFSAWLSLNMAGYIVTSISMVVLALIIISSFVLLIRYRKEVRSILIGMFPIAFSAIVISTFSGIVLGASFDLYLKGTVFLLLIPAFNGQGGSMGSILGSRLSSAGYLGEDRMTLLPNRTGRASTITLWMISLLVFSFMGLAGVGIGTVAGIEMPSALMLMSIMLLGATMITIVSSLIAYYVTYISFKVGLDPDNVVIPLLTSVMDVVGSGSLLVSILIMTSIL